MEITADGSTITTGAKEDGGQKRTRTGAKEDVDGNTRGAAGSNGGGDGGQGGGSTEEQEVTADKDGEKTERAVPMMEPVSFAASSKSKALVQKAPASCPADKVKTCGDGDVCADDER